MTRRIRFTRSSAIIRLQHQLEQDSYPRLQMAFIVSLTGAAGLLCSFAMLRGGVDSMTLRYPLAVVISYLIFLLLLWIWLRARGDQAADAADALNGFGSGSGDGVPPAPGGAGGGGHFSGGGASGSFDGRLSEPAPGASVSDSSGIDIGLDFDEFAVPLAILLFVVGLVLASLYVIYLAPALFAEMLLDAALSYSLYRHLRGRDSSHWLMTALRYTAIPFALTAAVLSASGEVMHRYVPEATSIGAVLQHWQAHQRQ
jgi:hypothetical protein